MLQIADDLKCQIVNYDGKQPHFYLEHHERFWFWTCYHKFQEV